MTIPRDTELEILRLIDAEKLTPGTAATIARESPRRWQMEVGRASSGGGPRPKGGTESVASGTGHARVVSMGRDARGREARDGDRLAPSRLRPLLGAPVSSRGPPVARPDPSRAHRAEARENPTWSRRRIASDFAKLGHVVRKDTVARDMPRRRPPSRLPSQTWGTFIRNHLAGTLAIDFLTVPTATFSVLYVFFVLSLERRRVLHVNVTAHPYAAWAAQQMIEAVAPDVVAERVIRDRDGIFGAMFDKRLAGMGLKQLRISPRAPWQNGFAERFVGTIRRELLDHVIVVGERHLLRLVRDYVRFYNDDRPHMALDGDAPAGRAMEGPEGGDVIALPRVGGLHHRYSRAA
jgi:putative transposase